MLGRLWGSWMARGEIDGMVAEDVQMRMRCDSVADEAVLWQLFGNVVALSRRIG